MSLSLRPTSDTHYGSLEMPETLLELFARTRTAENG